MIFKSRFFTNISCCLILLFSVHSQASQPDGYRAYTWSNGDKYVGQWKGNQFHGQGTYTFKNGDRYVGQYKNDKRHGQGVYTYANGTRIAGQWKNDLHIPKVAKKTQPRKAVQLKSDQKIILIYKGIEYRYVGQLKDGKPHGKGSLFSTEHGDKYSYVGQFKNGEFHGQGLYVDGLQKYVGQFKNGKNHGQGTLLFKTTYRENFGLSRNSKYVGQFKNGRYHGQGTYIPGTRYESDEAKYVGQFRDGKRHGQGTLTYLDGSALAGQWTAGKHPNERKTQERASSNSSNQVNNNSSRSIKLCVPLVPTKTSGTSECRAITASSSYENATVYLDRSRGTCYTLKILAAGGGFGNANTCGGASDTFAVSAKKPGGNVENGYATGLSSAIAWMLRRL